MPGFSGKKQPRPSVFWKARRHWGREWAEKMGWLYPSSVNSRRIIRLKRRIKSDELSVQIEQRPFLHLRWIIRLRRIIHLQNPSKLTEKQMDKVRRIVHAKLRPFHFQITTYYWLSDANYPTDNSSQTDNPSLVWIRLSSRFHIYTDNPSPVWKRQLSFNTTPNEFHALTQNGQFLNIHLPLISYCTLR